MPIKQTCGVAQSANAVQQLLDHIGIVHVVT